MDSYLVNVQKELEGCKLPFVVAFARHTDLGDLVRRFNQADSDMQQENSICAEFLQHRLFITNQLNSDINLSNDDLIKLADDNRRLSFLIRESRKKSRVKRILMRNYAVDFCRCVLKHYREETTF